MRLGSGPILAILKVKFWTKLSDKFWTKVNLADFYSGSRQILALALVLCVFVLADGFSHFVEMVFVECVNMFFQTCFFGQ